MNRQLFFSRNVKHHGNKTLCRGDTGPRLAKEWGRQRKSEARGTRILTYRAGRRCHFPEPGNAGKVKTAVPHSLLST
ncbi:MAG: hypothetical protein AB1545_04730 [Thermodesulfobacteriota bacterium]